MSTQYNGGPMNHHKTIVSESTVEPKETDVANEAVLDPSWRTSLSSSSDPARWEALTRKIAYLNKYNVVWSRLLDITGLEGQPTRWAKTTIANLRELARRSSRLDPATAEELNVTSQDTQLGASQSSTKPWCETYIEELKEAAEMSKDPKETEELQGAMQALYQAYHQRKDWQEASQGSLGQA